MIQAVFSGRLLILPLNNQIHLADPIRSNEYFNLKTLTIMSRKIETIEMISGQLDVVEAKLNELLKKFGYDEDMNIYNLARNIPVCL
jgi:hypothetical protein